MVAQRLRQNLYCRECRATRSFEKQVDGTWKCPVCGRLLHERT